MRILLASVCPNMAGMESNPRQRKLAMATGAVTALALFCLLCPILVFGQMSTIEVSFPAADIQEKIKCSEDFEKTFEVTWEDRLFQVYVPTLVNTPVIRGRSACRAFLRAWQKSHRPTNRIIFPLELIQEEFSDAAPQRYRILSGTFYRECRDLGFCSENAFDFFSVKSELKRCQPEVTFASWWEKMRPRFLRPVYKKIPKVSVKAFPFQPLTEDLKLAALEHARTAVLGSTMSVGVSSLYGMSEKLLSGTRPVFLALDAGVLFAAREGAILPNYFLTHPVLHAVPMTSGVYYKSVFHWKIVTDLNADIGILSSMNLSNPLKTPFIDFSYEFSSRDVREELRDYLHWAMLKQCGRISDFECLASFSLNDAGLKRDAVKAARRGCGALREIEAPGTPERKRFFMQPQDTDLEQLVIDLVEEAKEEIVVLTHKFTLRGIAEALQKAKERGVQVHVLTTRNPHLGTALPSFFHYMAKPEGTVQMPEPHMKAMIIDRQELFFGTGNFTQNAFQDARELFAVTEDDSAIQYILRIAASLLLGHMGQSAPTFDLDNSPQQWVVGNIDDKSLQGLSPADNPWMPHYRKVNKSGLRTLQNCGLGYALFIPVEIYRECLLTRISSSEFQAN